MCKKGLLNRLVVYFVVLLICFLAYSSQIFVIWPWYGRILSVELVILLVPFNVFVGMLLWNYRLAVVTDPGRVPDGWKPSTHMDGFEVKKLTGKPRYCRMCLKYKPSRAHHCRQCERCVLRMDHHCPWVNNCVGHFNYGHFIRFLFFVDVSCSYHLAMVMRHLYAAMQSWKEPDVTELVLSIINVVVCIPVLLAVGSFSIYHFFGLMGNTTTIEGWEKDKAALMLRQGKIREIKYPYDVGRLKNIEQVLGKSVWLWCIPSVPPGNGLSFQLSDLPDDATLWRPRDPAMFGPDGEPKQFELPESPWTYENGALNPDLRPTSARKRPKSIPGLEITNLPPYHPDYMDSEYMQTSAQEQTDSTCDSTEDDVELSGAKRVRYGSEGYEVRTVDREEMLQNYLAEIGEPQTGKYLRYVPEPDSQSSDSNSDDIPLIQNLDKDR